MSGLIVVGITGAAGAGKDTVASMLGRGWWGVSFADPLYEMISAMTGYPVSQLKDREFKEQVIPWIGKSPRQLLQTLGTDWGRNTVAKDVWLKLGARRIRMGSRVVVRDVRFDDEAEMIHEEFGGVIWEVTRPGAATCVGHVSEAGISRHLISRTLVNAGTLDEFREVVQAAAASLSNATMKDIAGGSNRDGRIQGCAG
jgi:hypothetical protein